MEYDPSKVKFKINGVTVDEGIMTKLKHEIYSQVESIMNMIDDGVINESTGMKCKVESKDFSLTVDLDMKG